MWFARNRSLRSRLMQIGVLLAIAFSMVNQTTKVVSAQDTSPPENSPTTDGLAMLAAVELATTSAIEKAERSVVAIARVRRDQAPAARAENLRIPNELGFQEAPNSPDFVPNHYGSGVVISEDGFIVTCAHVLDDPRRNDYFVWLDKRVYNARIVGKAAQVYAADPFTDLAVLKIDPVGVTKLVPIVFAKTATLKKGQFVISLGNPYGIARDGQASASWGIVSNLNRSAPDTAIDKSPPNTLPSAKENLHQFGTLIQTDAKLNLGTSGGALINMRGEMVGLTTSLAAQSGYEQAAGFAIAVDELFLRVIESLKTGRLPEFGFLGIQPENLRAIDRERGLSGARIKVVVPGLPGDEAGLRSEDIIAQVNSQPIEDRNDLFRQLSQLPAGAKVELLVERPRMGQGRTDLLTLKTSLSKKFVATSQPGYAINGPQKWRGMLVEYATAVPSELTRNTALSTRRSTPKLALLAVDPDTPAWNAGLRPGYGLVSVDGQSVETPEAFYKKIADRTDRINLQIVRQDRLETVTIATDN